MSVFGNEARRERSRMRIAGVSATGDGQATQPMGDRWADAVAQERARRTAVPEADIEDAVEVAPESDGRRPAPAADDSSPRPVLMSAEAARDLRTRWVATQTGFVDDPRQAVQQADELVAAVIEKLEETLTAQRKELGAAVTDNASTESLRVALQHYRGFFRRLLAL
jgi:hypothetical protein